MFLCLGYPYTLPTTLYHPDTHPALSTAQTRRTRPYGRVLRVSGVPAPLPPPSTTQTRRTRLYGRILRVWDVADTPDMTTRPYGRVLRVWGVPAPSTAQTRGTRPQGRVLRVCTHFSGPYL